MTTENTDIPFRYFLRLWLVGFPQELGFELPQDDAERLRLLFQNLDRKNMAGNDFFRFEDLITHREIAVAFRDIQVAHVLWDAGLPSFLECYTPKTEDFIEIHFRGRSEPFCACAEYAEEIEDILAYLETLDLAMEAFCAFQDEDGETVGFNPYQVVMFSAPEGLGLDVRAEMLGDEDI